MNILFISERLLRLLSTYEELQKKRIEQLNEAIDAGLVQLQKGQSINADEAYRRLRKKLASEKKSR